MPTLVIFYLQNVIAKIIAVNDDEEKMNTSNVGAVWF